MNECLEKDKSTNSLEILIGYKACVQIYRNVSILQMEVVLNKGIYDILKIF